jgi:hypothetical protein
VTEFDISGDLSSQDNAVETSKFAEFWSWEEGPKTLMTHSVNVGDGIDQNIAGINNLKMLLIGQQSHVPWPSDT